MYLDPIKVPCVFFFLELISSPVHLLASCCSALSPEAAREWQKRFSLNPCSSDSDLQSSNPNPLTEHAVTKMPSCSLPLQPRHSFRKWSTRAQAFVPFQYGDARSQQTSEQQIKHTTCLPAARQPARKAPRSSSCTTTLRTQRAEPKLPLSPACKLQRAFPILFLLFLTSSLFFLFNLFVYLCICFWHVNKW